MIRFSNKWYRMLGRVLAMALFLGSSASVLASVENAIPATEMESSTCPFHVGDNTVQKHDKCSETCCQGHDCASACHVITGSASPASMPLMLSNNDFPVSKSFQLSVLTVPEGQPIHAIDRPPRHFS